MEARVAKVATVRQGSRNPWRAAGFVRTRRRCARPPSGLAALRRYVAEQPYRRVGVSTNGAMVRQLLKHALPPGSPPARTRNTVLYGWIADLRQPRDERQGDADAAVRLMSRTGEACRSRSFDDTPLIDPIGNLWWTVPITV